ncbi:MAG: nitroreductase family protein [Alphaproteobacteria bacterium]
MDLSTVDHLLTTTRSVRKRLDFAAPVDPAVVQKCVEIAIQAPTGSNQQGWHFVVVTDAAKRRALADLYRRGWDLYASARVTLDATDPRAAQMPRIVASAEYLAKHLHEAPVMIVPCIEGRVEQAPQFAQASVYGSILPAVWSLMLALRARGLGSAWTTIHLMFEKEAAEVLGIPDHVTQSALLPVARFTGADFKPASRIPARDRTYWDTWGARR